MRTSGEVDQPRESLEGTYFGQKVRQNPKEISLEGKRIKQAILAERIITSSST